MTRLPFLLASMILPAMAGASGPSLDSLGWLAGCWSADGGEPGSGETWMAPAGGTMLGMSRTVRGGKTVTWEFLRIVDDGEGGIDYVASPAGQATAAFTLIRASEGELVFENPEHDFPQRVIYRQRAGGRLLARIEGTADGRARGVDFPMTRTDCGG